MAKYMMMWIKLREDYNSKGRDSGVGVALPGSLLIVALHLPNVLRGGIGGTPLDGHRHIWWNFVSSRKERIEQAKLAWANPQMDSVPGEHEWIPLP